MTPKQLEAIKKHGENLNKIFKTDMDPITLTRKLHRIESAAHKLAEDACNWLSMESTEYEKRHSRVVARVKALVGNKVPVKINMDPRGYALKIDDEYMRKHNLQLYKDWGGYGILAPEFDKNGN